MGNKLSRDDLVKLVEKILKAEGTGEDIHVWVNLFQENVPYPEASDLIYWPSTCGLDLDPSPEDIVEKALNYKPIRL